MVVSGLPVKDAKAGLETAKQWLTKEKIDDKTYWMPENMPEVKSHMKTTHLLAGFDEYIISYKDRSSCLDAKYAGQVISKNGIFNPVIITNGLAVGTWKRVITKDKVVIQKNLFTTLNRDHQNAINAVAKKYAKFIGKVLE